MGAPASTGSRSGKSNIDTEGGSNAVTEAPFDGYAPQPADSLRCRGYVCSQFLQGELSPHVCSKSNRSNRVRDTPVL